MRRALLIVPLLAVAAGLAGCGGSGGNPVTKAVVKTEKADGTRVELTATFTVLLDETTHTMTGAGQFGPDGGEMTFDVADFLRLSPLLTGSTDAPLKAIYLDADTGPVVFSSFPFVTGRLPAGKTWMKLDVARAISALPYETMLALGITLEDPGRLLDLLRTSTSATRVGVEQVSGSQLTHYTTSVHLNSSEKLGKAEQTMGQILNDQGALTDAPADVWVGEDGLVHRMKLEWDTATTEQIQSELAVELTLTGTASPVSVGPPPAARVHDSTADALRRVTFQAP